MRKSDMEGSTQPNQPSTEIRNTTTQLPEYNLKTTGIQITQTRNPTPCVCRLSQSNYAGQEPSDKTRTGDNTHLNDTIYMYY